MMSFKQKIIMLLLFAQQVCGLDLSLLKNYPVNWSGYEELRKKDYQDALQKVLSDSSITDTVHHYFKLACIHQKLENYGKSLFLFRFVAQKCSTLAPVAYEHIAQLELDSGQLKNVLPAYSAALRYSIPKKYQRKIFEKINSLPEIDSASIKKEPWYDEFLKWVSKSKNAGIIPGNRYESIVKSGSWASVDSLLDSLQIKQDLSCEEVLSIASIDIIDSLSSKNLVFLSQLCFSCNKFKLADSVLKKAKNKLATSDNILAGKALYLESQILYELGDIPHAIASFKKYEQKYGTNSDLILYVARGYRKLGKVKESKIWYSKLVRMYPQHKKAHEVIWLRAWQNEELKNFKTAIKDYRYLYASKGKNEYREEAYIRHALVHYRLQEYDSAIVVLDNLKKKIPSTSFYLAADFWKAKCYFAKGQERTAKELFRKVSQREPYDYYAHRSRQLLNLLGDSHYAGIDTVLSVEQAIKWLDSISPAYPKKEMSRSDSADYRRGILLASVGRVDVAEYFLETLESDFSGNLSLQFNIAMLYTLLDASTPAFRVARRLTWRIPPEARGNIPLAVYALLYPSFYSETIRNHGSKYNVDPHLVSSVIRQESIFNPVIKSPVGAVGLMQIMPYTGQDIAKKLSEAFVVDSLIIPQFNIRYGVFYLKELLNQFNDNMVLALASYNGGPHNAKKWYEKNKDEEYDLFVEDLFFSETRNYVKKVLGNYWTYQFLAKNPGVSYVYNEQPQMIKLTASDSTATQNR